MSDFLKQLLTISSDSLGDEWDPEWDTKFSDTNVHCQELIEFLKLKNGFFAFESALHVFPIGNRPEQWNLSNWNEKLTWRCEYKELIPVKMLFFAEDIFGDQFSLDQHGYYSFDSETGSFEPMGVTLEEWAELLFADWKNITGFEIAHEWQIINGMLQPAERLIPKFPFVTGGEYEIANLYAGNAAEAMRFRGDFAQQIKDLPDGTAIEFVIKNLPDDPPASEE